MQFKNFSLTHSPEEVIVLVGNSRLDLHNFGEFLGLSIEANGIVAVAWKVLQNPYRREDANPESCAFVFRGVKSVLIYGKDEDLPESEDKTLHGISRIIPGDAKPYMQSKALRKWDGESFYLLFEFRGGLSVEIDAKEAEFITGQAGSRS